jgi:hypothetical protein
MSRAINLRVAEADVVARCAAGGVSISAIEPLPSGGTHLVCTTMAGAEEIRRQLHDHIIEGVVRRFPFHRSRGPW